MLKLSIAIVLAAVIMGGSLLLSGRYELVPTENNDMSNDSAWHIDRLTGDVVSLRGVCWLLARPIQVRSSS